MKKNKMFESDLYRFYGETAVKKINWPIELRYIYFFRRAQSVLETKKSLYRSILYRFFLFKLNRISLKSQIQIPITTKIGKGFYIGHSGRVIINGRCMIGENVNIATGVTIGAENRGSRKGVPKIGNKVWIGTNAVVVGNITIGNDVMIAPLAFVNFDVPDHSIVIGNPARIISCENATAFYVENIV